MSNVPTSEKSQKIAHELADAMYPALLTTDENLQIEHRVKFIFARRMLELALDTCLDQPLPEGILLDQREDLAIGQAIKGILPVLDKMSTEMAVEVYEKALGTANG